MLEPVGDRLREERIRLGIDQRSFGPLGGVNRNSQINYEAGRTPCNVEYLLKLAAHGVDIGYVLTGQRSDSSLGFMEKQVFEMFGQLSSREKGAVFSLLSELTGNAADASNPLQPVPMVHAPAREYKGMKEGE